VPTKAVAAPAGRTWVSFFASREPGDVPFVGVVLDGGITRYRVDRVTAVSGRPLAIAAGWQVLRVESRGRIPAASADLALAGVTQHLAYTGARERGRLERLSRQEPGKLAVLVPIAKSDAWWNLSQDERLAIFKRSAASEGHVAIGQRFASSVLRRLYHARYVPGSEWDFLTYFEIEPGEAPVFQKMLEALRNPRRNPEWGFVVRETEIWMRKV
jgi:hypothetical protein